MLGSPVLFFGKILIICTFMHVTRKYNVGKYQHQPEMLVKKEPISSMPPVFWRHPHIGGRLDLKARLPRQKTLPGRLPRHDKFARSGDTKSARPAPAHQYRLLLCRLIYVNRVFLSFMSAASRSQVSAVTPSLRMSTFVILLVAVLGSWSITRM